MPHVNRVKQLLANFSQVEFNASIPNINNEDVAREVYGDVRRSRKRRFMPMYFADDDLEVLRTVKSWEDEDIKNYYWWILAALLRSRDRYYDDTKLSLTCMYYIENYRCGDYSRAAVMTLRALHSLTGAANE